MNDFYDVSLVIVTGIGVSCAWGFVLLQRHASYYWSRPWRFAMLAPVLLPLAVAALILFRSKPVGVLDALLRLMIVVWAFVPAVLLSLWVALLKFTVDRVGPRPLAYVGFAILSYAIFSWPLEQVIGVKTPSGHVDFPAPPVPPEGAPLTHRPGDFSPAMSDSEVSAAAFFLSISGSVEESFGASTLYHGFAPNHYRFDDEVVLDKHGDTVRVGGRNLEWGSSYELVRPSQRIRIWYPRGNLLTFRHTGVYTNALLENGSQIPVHVIGIQGSRYSGHISTWRRGLSVLGVGLVLFLLGILRPQRQSDR